MAVVRRYKTILAGAAFLALVTVAFVGTRRYLAAHPLACEADAYREEMIYPTVAAERQRGNPLVGGMMVQEYTSGGYWLQTLLYQPLVARPACARPRLKWVPIGFSAFAFAWYAALARKFFGRRAGWAFAALAILGVPLALELQTIGWANHNESQAFVAPVLFALFWLSFEESRRLPRMALVCFFLGLWTALGVVYCFSTFVPAAYVVCVSPLVVAGLVGRRRYGRAGLLSVPAGLAGAFLGAWILFWVRSQVDHPFFGMYGRPADIPVTSFLGGLVGDARRGGSVDEIASRFGQAFIQYPSMPHRWENLVVAAITALSSLVAFALPAGTALSRRAGPASPRNDARPDDRARLFGPAIPAGLAILYLCAFTAVEKNPIPVTSSADFWSAATAFRYVAAVPSLVLLTIAGLAASASRIRPRAPRTLTWGVVFILVLLGARSFVAVRGPVGRAKDNASCTDYWVLTRATIGALHKTFFVADPATIVVEPKVSRQLGIPLTVLEDEEAASGMPPRQARFCAVLKAYVGTYDPAHASEIGAAVRAFAPECPDVTGRREVAF